MKPTAVSQNELSHVCKSNYQQVAATSQTEAQQLKLRKRWSCCISDAAIRHFTAVVISSCH